MKTLEIESALNVSPETDCVESSDYDHLLVVSRQLGSTYDVPRSLLYSSFQLLSRLRDFDKKTAKESMQVVPLALTAGKTIGDFYDISIDYSSIWAASLLHDLGKTAVPKCIIDKSNEGKEWTDSDREIMRIHPFAGADQVRSYGMPENIARPIEEHHHKQIGSFVYGKSDYLTPSERITRDCVAAADFTDAALNRANTRNQHLSRSEREAEVAVDVRFLFDDYPRGGELAASITRNLVSTA